MAGMHRKIHWFILLYLSWVLIVPSDANAQFAFQVAIDSPQAGEAVQGVVPVSGTSAVDGFISYQLAFSHSEDPTETWFVLANSADEINNDVLGEWDTSNITDGTYQLRLIVQRDNEEPIVVFVEELRVRNYTPIETETRGPTKTPAPGETAAPSKTPLPITPTDFPVNPAILAAREIRASILAGIAIASLILLILGVKVVLHRRRTI
jgi:hypothetical protein